MIDRQYASVEEISNKFDVMGVVGNGASYKTQMEAGIEKADILIAVTGSDELNLLCCLIAKRAGNCQTIARVRNPEYSAEIGFVKEALGLAMTINPEFAAAQEIARVLRFPSAIKIDTFAKGRVEMLKFRVPAQSRLDGMLVMSIAPKLGADVLVCAVERGGEIFIPKGDFRLQEKDVLSIIADPKKASDFFKKIGIETHQVKDTMIVGGGDTAYYLAKLLLPTGIDVKLIERDERRCSTLSELLPKAQIIHADGSEQIVLIEEGVGQAEAFVALTNIDEENIMLALYAKSLTNAKLITKVHRISYDEIIDSLDVGSIIYPKYITAESIIKYVRAMKNSIGSNIETLYRLNDNRVEALELLIKEDSPMVGKPLSELRLKPNVLIGCITRRGQVTIPNGQSVIHVGDTIILITTTTGFHQLEDALM